MAISKTTLCNMALSLVGEDPINALSDNNKAALLANRIYDQIELECFAVPFELPFCNRHMQLSALTINGSRVDPDMGWDRQYVIPTYVQRVLKTVDVNADVLTYRWRREVYVDTSSGTAKEYDVLLSNETTCYVKVRIRRQDPNARPAWFNRLLYYRMAMILSKPLAREDPRRSQIERDYIEVYNEAKACAGLEGDDTNVFGASLDRGHDMRSEVQGLAGFRNLNYNE